MVKLLILKNDFIVIGEHVNDPGNFNTLILKNAALLKTSGQALGYITLQGPVSSTVIDPCGDLEITLNAILISIDCNSEKWVSALTGD